MMTHNHQIRVYYEDTDLAGIVYYANYLKFIERGRSEWVRTLGVDQAQLKAEGGGVFAVRRVVADYRAPAVYDDLFGRADTLYQPFRRAAGVASGGSACRETVVRSRGHAGFASMTRAARRHCQTG